MLLICPTEKKALQKDERAWANEQRREKMLERDAMRMLKAAAEQVLRHCTISVSITLLYLRCMHFIRLRKQKRWWLKESAKMKRCKHSRRDSDRKLERYVNSIFCAQPRVWTQ
jgi:hypothetical protein